MWVETDLDMVDVGGRIELAVANDARLGMIGTWPPDPDLRSQI